MKRIVGALFSLMIILLLSACGNRIGQGNSEEISTVVEVQSEKEQSITTQEAEEQSGRLQGTVQEPEDEEPVNGSSDEQEADVNTKTLVVYFSCTGTTELVAEYVSEILGADLYEIVAEEPYTEADLAYYTNGRADQEQNDPDVRPAISGGVEKYGQI